MKTNNLTEQWKNEQLESFRWYYVKFKTGEIDICWLTEWSNDELGTGGQYFDGIEDKNILEVLAPVPSYEDWQGLNMNCEFIHKCYEGAKEKNKQLEDELKQKHLDYCKEIDWVDTKSRYYYSELTRIKKQSNEDYKLAEFREQELKDLLKECREWIEFMEEKSRADENYKGTMYFKNLLTKLDGVLK